MSVELINQIIGGILKLLKQASTKMSHLNLEDSIKGTISKMTLTLNSPTTNLLLHEISRGGTRLIQNSSSTKSFPELYAKWFELSSPVRFCVSGNFGNLCFYFIERLVYHQLCQIPSLPNWIEDFKDSVSFAIGYLLQIVTQHLLHAFLVYGLDTINTKEKYLKTLLGQTYVYSFALVGSTILNLFLLRAGIEKTKAFFLTMIIFAVFNYFLIELVVQRAISSSSVKKSSIKKSTQTRGGALVSSSPYNFTTRTNLAVPPIDVKRVNDETCSSSFKWD